MKKPILLNLIIITPLALWGFIAPIMCMVLRNTNSAELKVGIIISIIMMLAVYILYYILLRMYLKNCSYDTSKDRLYSVICLALVFAFAIISLLL